MDTERFDRLVIALSRRVPRRSVLGLLGGLGFTGLVTWDVAGQTTCLTNGTRCGGERGVCCSGWCKRKRGTNKKFCRQADGEGTCTIEADICHNKFVNCGTGCECVVTTQGRSFCAVLRAFGDGCVSNQECEQHELGGKGAKCIDGGTSCGSATFCMPPCS
jgi:hypothetical protein